MTCIVSGRRALLICGGTSQEVLSKSSGLSLFKVFGVLELVWSLPAPLARPSIAGM